MLWKYRRGYRSPNTSRFFAMACILIPVLFSPPTPYAATQAMGPRTATTAASVTANPVRGVSQYKYATGVRNTQQHVNAQPQVTVQQVEP